MGIVRTVEMRKAEIEELRRMIIHSPLHPKSVQEVDDAYKQELGEIRGVEVDGTNTVCVTSGLSYLGLSISNELLLRGYTVRVGVQNQDELEKLKDMEVSTNRVFVVMAKLMDVESLCQAFDGCQGVFHTSSFVDSGGLSGYNKYMADFELKAAENVIEACSRTSSVRKCIFTSSLLACVWRNTSSPNLQQTVDETCWSEENLCRDKKLWLALGKTMAEKGAWRRAREMDVNLVTICTALITGPGSCDRNPTGSIAYLKGAYEMYTSGLLATVDVRKAAKAHVLVYELMNQGACGRYICFDNVVSNFEDASDLETTFRLRDQISNAAAVSSRQFELKNAKLCRLLSNMSTNCLHSVYLEA